MPAKSSTPQSKEVAAHLARESLRRKKHKTPLEDALAQGNGGARTVRLVQWARAQQAEYYGQLATWRANRKKYAQEAADVFEHRNSSEPENHDPLSCRLIFKVRNESLNVVAGLAEFAAAQAEQDIFGGEPWFAATPVGKNDPVLADTIQKHLQWTFRDGRLVQKYCDGITTAACLGESFTKTCYQIETDEYEEEINALHSDGKPLMQLDGKFVTTDDEAKKLKPTGKKLEWKTLYQKREEIIFHGIQTSLLNHNDVAFREDAEELNLRYTNFYNIIELSVSEAISKFKLSTKDAIRLAQASNTTNTVAQERAATVDSPGATASGQEQVLGDEERERLMNMRVRLIEGWVCVDPFGDGKARRLYIVFPPQSEDWLVYGDYLGNVSPKGELPIKVHPWERVPGKLYGRGFFSKYAAVQTKTDDLWNQVSFRNSMSANPVAGVHLENLEREDDESDIEIKPGVTLRLKGDKTLAETLEFMEIPDLDKRSMELLQIGIQMAQTRSGITSASQGDLSAVPENNTATGIRSLMSRAAVLLKKPVRTLRRSFGVEFSYGVRLHYTNFDREEAFVWGEGQTAELLNMSAATIRDLDIDVRMLLTQEQNQTKLEGAMAATDLFMKWLQIPEVEKASGRPLFLQAVKALEFDQAEEIIRKPAPTLEETIVLLPPDQQQRLQMLLQMEATAAPTTPAAQAAPTPQTPPALAS